jgi:hypothetical protein
MPNLAEAACDDPYGRLNLVNLVRRLHSISLHIPGMLGQS